ncbi:hypothetical protein BHM03_00042425 [Ensete ventricosum]|uniref:Uncharacterized protein n=1 Tax=Ensete ventricosum TaxID=4639 RepID=A0A445MKE0_ENSVE|nr:hypothetical protein BHM03_00042425 [Ensete ventricosum]
MHPREGGDTRRKKKPKLGSTKCPRAPSLERLSCEKPMVPRKVTRGDRLRVQSLRGKELAGAAEADPDAGRTPILGRVISYMGDKIIDLRNKIWELKATPGPKVVAAIEQRATDL